LTDIVKYILPGITLIGVVHKGIMSTRRSMVALSWRKSGRDLKCSVRFL